MSSISKVWSKVNSVSSGSTMYWLSRAAWAAVSKSNRSKIAVGYSKENSGMGGYCSEEDNDDEDEDEVPAAGWIRKLWTDSKFQPSTSIEWDWALLSGVTFLVPFDIDRVDVLRGVAIECVVLVVVMLFSGGVVGARGLTTPALVLSHLCYRRKRNRSLLSTASCCVYWRRRFDPAPDRDWLARNMIKRRKQRRIDTLFRCVVGVKLSRKSKRVHRISDFRFSILKITHF